MNGRLSNGSTAVVETPAAPEPSAEVLARPVLERVGDLLELQKRIETIRKTLGGAIADNTRTQAPRRRPTKFDYLVAQELITEEQLNTALAEARRRQVDVESILMDEYAVPKAEIGIALSQFYQQPFIAFDERMLIAPDLLKALKLEYLRKSGWVPLRREDDAVVVLVDDPHDLQKVDSIERLLDKDKIRWAVGFRKDILLFLDGAAGGAGGKESLANILEDLRGEEGTEQADDPASMAVDENDSSIIRLANQIILDAHRERASDIHVEPRGGQRDTLIRFRVDGGCMEYQRIPSAFRNPLVARLKIMAQLDIAERRLPQDGKIKVRLPDRELELRVATIPTVGGNEDVILRLLNSHEPIPLDKLGLTERNLTQVKAIAEKPYGLILCVGPTGSGKTTTLHALLGHINKPDRKIWTAEDPVEITQSGLRQVHVRPKIGWTFAAALRAFLRADPDVIMVGEMRDAETAHIAIEASLTGHLVLSTLHTNSAAESIVRLLDMGLDSFNFADAMLGILAQRLVKRVCADCRQAYHPAPEEYDELVRSYGEEDFAKFGLTYDPSFELYRGKGCARCNNTGFRGRAAIQELLIGSDEIKRLIQSRGRAADILAAAKREGMTTLVQDGVLKTLEGVTTLKQVKAVAIK
jgi:type II secretory ATPase GspE/PulE/Tfp pilus assembly ATPase PilB-like protein